MKICSNCKSSKSLADFYVDRHLKSGLTAACKTCILDRVHKYHRTERGRLVRKSHKRISRIIRRSRGRAIDHLTLEQLRAVYVRFNHQCFNCQSTEKLEVDHHMPLSLGYGLSPNNAVLLCASCNNAKSDRLPEDFYTPDALVRLAQLMC